MAIGFQIEGHSKGRSAAVQEGGSVGRYRPNGLITYQMPYETGNYTPIIATDEDGNIDLAIDGTTYAAVVENIHNGTDNTYWTASATVGTWTFDSVAQAYDGTKSIDGTGTTDGDIARFDGTTINPNSYTKFQAKLYFTSFPSVGNKALNVQFYNSSNVAVGNSINMYDYVNTSLLNTWQIVEIPLSDFDGLEEDVDRMDLTVVNTQGSPVDFYLDGIDLESKGGREFFLTPVKDEVTHITSLELSFVATSASTRNNDIDPTGFGFGSALTKGMIFKTNQTNYDQFSYTLTQNSDFFTFPGAEISHLYGDGTTAMFKFKLKYDTPLELNPNTRDYLSITVQDNLSSYGTIKFLGAGNILRRPDLTSI